MIRSSVVLGVTFLIAVTESANYLGCFRERSLQDRLFKGDLKNFTTTNTHEVCIDHCRSNGFLYAGVQFGRQCFCSYERPSYEWLANSEDDCNMPCSGDKSQVCGAHRRMGVYSLVEPGSLSTSYIGCHDGGALRELMGQSKDLSLEACKDFCEENRYRYFGAAEGSKCYCGNDIVSDNISERECRAPCGGDKTQLCGGTSEQLSVYRTSIPEPETANYIGCFRERSLQDRLFKGDLKNFTTTNTHEVCIDHCRSKGFLYAGVQFGRQCFCSSERPSYEWLANSEGECNMPCSGDPSQVCGAHRRMGVYSLVDPEPGSLSTSYIGCHAGGALREVMAQSTDLSLEKCKDVCEANRYRYFGAAQGSKCLCGNDVASDSISERECRAPCGGDKTQLCGGTSEQLSVYRTSIPKTETANYLGCFRERSLDDRLFKGDLQNFTTTNTHEVCTDHCRSNGFLYAGVQFGRQCFCSYERPSYEWLANSEDECNMPCSGDKSQVCGAHRRMGVYSLVDPEPGSLSTSYIGCQAGGALREVMAQSTDLSLERCKDVCEANRYRYFGAAQGSKCYCGNDIESDNISERECRAPCGGDKTQLCGGTSEQLSVYRTSIPEPETANYLGCFRERSLQDRLFKGDLQNFTTTNTHEVCIDHCRSNGFLYAGVQFGRQCFCSYERPSYEWLANSEDECNMPCSGDKSQVCGAHRRMGVYSLVDPEPGSLSTSYIGCHAGGALREVKAQSADLSLERCKDFCEANRYRYFGASKGTNCFCGNDITSDSISERECRVPCGGDKTQLCGGSSEQLSVYRTSIPDEKKIDVTTIDASSEETTVPFSTKEERETWIVETETEPVTTYFTSTIRQTERPAPITTSWFISTTTVRPTEKQAVSTTDRPISTSTTLPTERPVFTTTGRPIITTQLTDMPAATTTTRPLSTTNTRPTEMIAIITTSMPVSTKTTPPTELPAVTITARPLNTTTTGPTEIPIFITTGTPVSTTTTVPTELSAVTITARPLNTTTTRPTEIPIFITTSKSVSTTIMQPTKIPDSTTIDESVSTTTKQLTETPAATPTTRPVYTTTTQPTKISASTINASYASTTTTRPTEIPVIITTEIPVGTTTTRTTERPATTTTGRPVSSTTTQLAKISAATSTASYVSTTTTRPTEIPVIIKTDTPVSTTTTQPTKITDTATTDRSVSSTTKRLTETPAATTTTRPVSTTTTQTTKISATSTTASSASNTTTRPTEKQAVSTTDTPVITTTRTTERPAPTTTGSPISITTTQPTTISPNTATARPVSSTTTRPTERPSPTTTVRPVSITTTQPSTISPNTVPARPVSTTTTQPTKTPAATTTAKTVTTTTTRPTERPAPTTTSSPVSITTTQPNKIPYAMTTTRPVSTTTTRTTERPVSKTSGRPVNTTTTQPPKTTASSISNTTARPSEIAAPTTTGRLVSTTIAQQAKIPDATTTAKPSTTTTRPTERPDATTTARPVSTTTMRPTDRTAPTTTGRPVSITTTQPTKIPAATTTDKPVTTTTTQPTERPAPTTTIRPVSTTTAQQTKISVNTTTARPVSTTTTRPTERPSPTTTGRPVSNTTTRPTERPASTTTGRPVSTTTAQQTKISVSTTTARPVSTTTTQPTKVPAAATTTRPGSTTTTRPTERPSPTTTGKPVSTTTTKPTTAATTTSRLVSTTNTRPTVRPTSTITAWPSQNGKYKKKKKSSSSSSSSEEKKKKKFKKNKKSKEDKKNKKIKKKSKRSIAMYTSHAIGCYKDEQSKLLPDLMVKLYSENTPRACVDFCGPRNYSYAGVQRHECFCSNKKPVEMNETNIKNCSSPCPGHSLEFCGGRGFTSVFEMNL